MTIEPLDLKRHAVERFACGRTSLDRWLREYAGQGQRRDTSRTFVAASADGDVVGYYTLVAGQVERDQATDAVRAGTSKHFPIPICLIARPRSIAGRRGEGSAPRYCSTRSGGRLALQNWSGFAPWSFMRWTTSPPASTSTSRSHRSETSRGR